MTLMSSQPRISSNATNGVSNGGAHRSADGAFKKNRVRACDQCRRRKVKCDSSETLQVGISCVNCIESGLDCTYVGASENRFKDLEYVRGLEKELSELKEQLRKLKADGLAESPSSTTAATDSDTAPSVPEQDALAEDMQSLRILPMQGQFWGKSSQFVFTRAAAMALRQEDDPMDESAAREADESEGICKLARQLYWSDDLADMIPTTPPHPRDAFPRPDLMGELIKNYFTHLNNILPLIHRPTFERNMEANLHLSDETFGSIVLMVCAIGSRFSDDRTVLPPKTDKWEWAGWHWFQRVRAVRQLVQLSSPQYQDLQVSCMLAYYVLSSPASFGAYAVMGHGVRLAQDMGAHRKSTYSATPNVEDELKKRAFWCLVFLDRGLCQKLGRPYSFHDDEIDADFPIECDDEYWENDDPMLNFKQPEGRPSTMVCFNRMLLLGRIHGHALQTIYSPEGSAMRSDAEYAQKVVSDLDSEMNQFMDSIPEHLKWDPNQPDPELMRQSALLHSHYYHMQCTIHRPFIPLPGRPSPISVPSLAICTNAARACVSVLDTEYIRVRTHSSLHQMSLFSAGVILLLNIWTTARGSSRADTRADFVLVEKAMRMIAAIRPRFRAAGRLWDVLHELLTIVRASSACPQANGSQHSSQVLDQQRQNDGGGSHPDVPDNYEPSTFAISQNPFDFQTQGPSGAYAGWQGAPSSSGTMSSISQNFDVAGTAAYTQGSTMPNPYDFGGADISQLGFDPDFEAVFANLVHEGSYGTAFRYGTSALNANGQGMNWSPLSAGSMPQSENGMSSMYGGNIYPSVPVVYGQRHVPSATPDVNDFPWG